MQDLEASLLNEFSCFYKLYMTEMGEEGEEFEGLKKEERVGNPQAWVGGRVMT